MLGKERLENVSKYELFKLVFRSFINVATVSWYIATYKESTDYLEADRQSPPEPNPPYYSTALPV